MSLKKKVLRGPAHPSWKGGRRDYVRRNMPERLLAAFDAIVNNPDLTSVRDLMGITGARLQELVAKLGTFESRAAWDAMGDAIAELEGALAGLPKGQARDQSLAFAAIIREHYKAARHEYRLWDEIHETIERARRLAETERKREEMLQGNITAQQAIALFNHLFTIITETVTDLATRAALAERLRALLQTRTPAAALPPGVKEEEISI